MHNTPKKSPKRIGFRGRDGAVYSFTRMTVDGVEGIQVDSSDPEDRSAPPESFFVPCPELEDFIDALSAFVSNAWCRVPEIS